MRRYSFLIGALSAILTFVALSAFTGRRPWSREARWPYGWHRHHWYDHDRYFDRDDDRHYRDNRNGGDDDRRENNRYVQPQSGSDSLRPDYRRGQDSATNP